MHITDFLQPQNIIICDDKKCTKKRVLEMLSNELASISGIETNVIFQELIARERIGSTALGNGVALPHVRLEGLKKPVAVFLKLESGVDFDSPDELPVDLIFGLLVPESATEQHLQILSKIAELFHDSVCRSRIRECSTPQSVFQLLNSQSCILSS
jgi:PTS system nitrogen regulatory IIA component